MTDESNDDRRIEPPHPQSCRQSRNRAPGVVGDGWRWGIAVAIVVLLTYPVVRWMISGEGGTAVTGSAAGAKELQLSFEYYRDGRYQDAIAAAKAAIAANPSSANAYNNLAVSYMGLHQVDDAIHAAQEAIRLDPNFQLAKNNLAWFQQERLRSGAGEAR